MLVRSVGFTLRRMLRSYIGYLFLIVLPLAIITLSGMAARHAPVDEWGRSVMDTVAVGVIIGFQLVGGFYTMETMKSDLFSPVKWRLHASPYPLHTHAFAILISSALYGVLNGLVTVLFTQWVYGVNWGNIGWVLVVLLLVSLVSQLFFMMAVLAIRRYKIAELIGYAYVFGWMTLAGYFFVRLPDTAFMKGVNTYLNPLSMGETAIVGRLPGMEPENVWLSAGLLLAESVILSVIVILVGRRRLA